MGLVHVVIYTTFLSLQFCVQFSWVGAVEMQPNVTNTQMYSDHYLHSLMDKYGENGSLSVDQLENLMKNLMGSYIKDAHDTHKPTTVSARKEHDDTVGVPPCPNFTNIQDSKQDSTLENCTRNVVCYTLLLIILCKF